MKQLYTILLTGCLLLPTACIEDKGNYDYTAPDVPEVVIEKTYQVFVGDRLVIEPQVTFPNTEALEYQWSIIDPDQMTEHDYTGQKLDIVFGLQAKTYSARLTVLDTQTGMKYFYPFSIVGQMAFGEGVVLLTSVGGQARLSFVKPDGTVQENLYENMHNELLPTLPRQLVPLQHANMMGKPYLGYWIVCGDTEHPGVEIDANTLSRIKTFRENFFTPPEGELHAGDFIARNDATMAGVINGKFYVGAFSTYYLSPVYGYFGNPILGDYELESCLAVAPDGTFVWAYDRSKQALACFIPPGDIYFAATSMPGPPPAFDPANLALELITLLSSNSGFYLFGHDAGGSVQELKFSTGGQMVISQYKRPFCHPELITDNTKWVLQPGVDVFYFSSGKKVYRYNPLNELVEELSTAIAANVSMLKAGREANQLVVGCEGHLYWLDISAGNEGKVLKDVSGFTGEPIDIYDRKDDI